MSEKLLSIKNIYLYLVLGNTLAASFIWGINTIFLLDAGLSNFEAFLANALFSLGMVIFEVPTGIVADTYGRRVSYLLGTITLSLSTAAYLLMWQIEGPFWGWAVSSMLLGLGFTFFSGALEAWLVDALTATNYKGHLEAVLAKGQIVGGAAMLTGSLLGGVIAQYSSLGIPYILRSLILVVNFAVAFVFMKDLGFTPSKPKKPFLEMKRIFVLSIDHGLKNPPVRWIMFASPLLTGVSFYIFYALQPFLLELYGDSTAYAVAGLVAAIAALAQICGGVLTPYLRKIFNKRTSVMFFGISVSAIAVLLAAFTNNFYVALVLIFVWGLMFAALMPINQAYLNGLIPSAQRATVLSFNSLMGSSGGIVIQPVLGKAADVWNYSVSFGIASIIQFSALPFIILARHEKPTSDVIEKELK
ncbi:MAG: MFS transporter [Candidatus Levybacteria bacterium RIFCSPLOWO2_01_FULL_39_10]|nr:MAG: MFS transporter [Candidatus Levybacteria bacterium RIFCSPLOWO2_01_FULL_39_10]